MAHFYGAKCSLTLAVTSRLRLERSPGLCQDVVIVYGAQTTAEIATVQGILW